MGGLNDGTNIGTGEKIVIFLNIMRGYTQVSSQNGVAQTYGNIFTFTIYGVLYQCESGYTGIRDET